MSTFSFFIRAMPAIIQSSDPIMFPSLISFPSISPAFSAARLSSGNTICLFRVSLIFAFSFSGFDVLSKPVKISKRVIDVRKGVSPFFMSSLSFNSAALFLRMRSIMNDVSAIIVFVKRLFQLLFGLFYLFLF